jgi:hypothetical protein
MKNKLLLIIALLGIAIAFNYVTVLAQQQEAPPATSDSAKWEIPVEFSNYSSDKAAQMGTGGWGLDGLDAQQNIYTQPPDFAGGPYPVNTFDFDNVDNPSGDQVDALANGGDVLFSELIANRANLLVSFLGDPATAAVPGTPISVYMEGWWAAPNTSSKWKKTHLVNDTNTINDLDALEVWGPLGSDDADFYSLIGEPGGISVFYYNSGTGVSTPYITQAAIVAAVTSLGGPSTNVDLDALMVYENGGISGNHIWDTGDAIIFSIRASAPWDGGEIVVLPFGGPATFLNHGGHLWNTAFAVATTFGLSPATEEVDAIEAYPRSPDSQTPTLTEWGLIILVALLIASTAFILLRRRKSAVPA